MKHRAPTFETTHSIVGWNLIAHTRTRNMSCTNAGDMCFMRSCPLTFAEPSIRIVFVKHMLRTWRHIQPHVYIQCQFWHNVTQDRTRVFYPVCYLHMQCHCALAAFHIYLVRLWRQYSPRQVYFGTQWQHLYCIHICTRSRKHAYTYHTYAHT